MPGIDISQLTTLDQRDVVVAGPPPQAFAPPPQAFAPPPDAFGPGGDDVDPPIGVERSTRAIRIENEWQLQREAKQVAAAAPPPAPRRQIGGVVIAIGLIAAVAIALVVIVMQPEAPGAAGSRSGVAAQPARR
jgi:hypothetical protein